MNNEELQIQAKVIEYLNSRSINILRILVPNGDDLFYSFSSITHQFGSGAETVQYTRALNCKDLFWFFSPEAMSSMRNEPQMQFRPSGFEPRIENILANNGFSLEISKNTNYITYTK